MKPSRSQLALRLAAVTLCGACFIATSPPYWTDTMGFDWEPIVLDATHTAVALSGSATTAAGFDAPWLTFTLTGTDTGAGCIVTAYRLSAPWTEAYNEAGLPVIPEDAEALVEATVAGAETGVTADVSDAEAGEAAHILFASDGSCAFGGRARFLASAYASERSEDPQLDGEAELTAPAALLDGITRTTLDF